MGLGAGAAYVMGLTHLHEHVEDEMRGRVFATLFGMMRIGLFVSMALAVPLAGALKRFGDRPPQRPQPTGSVPRWRHHGAVRSGIVVVAAKPVLQTEARVFNS